MKLSSRTFGVEFELFFTKENFSKLLRDNIKILQRNWNDENLNPNSIKELKHEYEEAKEHDGFEGTFAAYKTEIRNQEVEDQISEIDNYNDYGNIDIVQDILEQRLKLDWNIHDDCSIQGHVPMEIVTPILKGEDGIRQIKKFLDYFGKYASVNNSTGLHVHVGASDFISKANKSKSAEMFAAALLYYSSFEEVFDSLVKSTRRKDKNHFTQSVNKPSETFQAFRRMQAAKGTNPVVIQGERYKKLNITAIDKHKTFEFRHMHGTLDFDIVKNWVKICTSFVDMVKDEYSAWSTFLKPAATKDTKLAEEAKEKVEAKIKNGFKNFIKTEEEKKIFEQVMNTLSLTNYDSEYHNFVKTENYIVFEFDASGLGKAKTNQLFNLISQRSSALRITSFSPYAPWGMKTNEVYKPGTKMTVWFINSLKSIGNNVLTEEQQKELESIKKKSVTRLGNIKGLPSDSIKKIQDIIKIEEVKNAAIQKKAA